MARVNAKQPMFARSPWERQLESLSKSALMDVVVDCCKRMFGEDVYAKNQKACINEVVDVILRHRGDKNPFQHASGTVAIGSAFDERPHERLNS